ncbi:velvet factor-domain-containing protein [Absidia repens]|uniref:Velvet factor-domain-containing protein n=1 Tax=Absidia repens TaxID=90262 RepID=A0A1X2IQP5_9FUNG|nr:velvet factor-domain-containing protein [Absidia repens]
MKWPHCSSEDTKMRLQSPFYFLVANIVDTENNDQLLLPAHNYLSGTTVSSLYRLRDLDNQDGGFYVFGDLSVKKNGTFKLQFSLFEIVEDGVRNQKTLLSEPFTVYLPKHFPGPLEATFLSRTFSDQGVKMRIRKEHRLQSTATRKRKTAPPHTSPDINNSENTCETIKRPTMDQMTSKRKTITPSYAPPQSHQVHFGKFGSSPLLPPITMGDTNNKIQQYHGLATSHGDNTSSLPQKVYPSPQSSTETKEQPISRSPYHHLSTPPSPTYTYPSPSMKKDDQPSSSLPHCFSNTPSHSFVLSSPRQPVSPPPTSSVFHSPPAPPLFYQQDHVWGSKLPPLRAIMTSNTTIDHQDDMAMHKRSFWQLPPIQFQ